MRSKTETVWIKHTELNLMYRSQLSLYWLEQIRRANAPRVHSPPIVIPSEARNLPQADGPRSDPSISQTSCAGSFAPLRTTALFCSMLKSPIALEIETEFYRFPNLTLAFARASAQHRPSHVAKISGLRVAWKNIEDNQ